MSYAYRCQVCTGHPLWCLVRLGDAVMSWACEDHLAQVCLQLQRPGETTQLRVSLAVVPAILQATS